jgi:hypothetical protein
MAAPAGRCADQTERDRESLRRAADAGRINRTGF